LGSLFDKILDFCALLIHLGLNHKLQIAMHWEIMKKM